MNIRILSFISLCTLVACGSGNKPTQISSQEETAATPEYLQPDPSDCIRSQAAPVTNKEVFPDAVFKLNSDNYTGTETVVLQEGHRLIIENYGCEYYVLSFRFVSNRFKEETRNTKAWMKNATFLMKEILPGLDSPLDLGGGILALENMITSTKEYQPGEEIVYNDSIIQDFVILEPVEKLEGGNYMIRITFGTGPL